MMNKPKRMRWAGHVALMGEMSNAYKILVRTPAGKRQLRRPRRRCEDNIRMNLRKTGWEVVDWIQYLRMGTSGGLF
jgi:hypothetical protein